MKGSLLERCKEGPNLQSQLQSTLSVLSGHSVVKVSSCVHIASVKVYLVNHCTTDVICFICFIPAGQYNWFQSVSTDCNCGMD